MTRARLMAAALGCWLAVLGGTAGAQSLGAPAVEVSGGVRWLGPTGFGNVSANEATPGGGTRPLFTTTTTLDHSFGATVNLGLRLTRSLQSDLTLSYSPTHLSARISGDVEGIDDVTVREEVTQFLLEAGVRAQLRRWQRSWASPFASGGVGYVRQLNAGRTLVQNGQSAYLGVGAYYVEPSRGSGFIRATGLRIEARALLLRGGVAPDNGLHVTPSLAASVFAWF